MEKPKYAPGKYFYYWKGNLSVVDISLEEGFYVYKCDRENFKTKDTDDFYHLKSTKREALKDYIIWQKVNASMNLKYILPMFKNIGYIFKALFNGLREEIKDYEKK